MKRFFLFSIIALGMGPLLFAQAAGAKRYVAVQSASVKDSTGFFAKELGTFEMGTELTLIREDGKWAEVKAGNLSGWVAASSLSARRIVAAVSTVTASEVALAGKGFSPDMELESKKSGVDYSMVDSMEQITVAPDDLLNFVTEGRLNKGE
jgi:SH3-like domain-containing protein